ncbi:hypothetical protein [Frankia sp. Cas3]|uniref:hypothetical protein n=1 Tax=Frankia sp. Cas3 TaxID=3073926 RepID=UPI002AD56C6C|nr:hypothetical protein [Frankia sp. Cas3]
MSLIPPWVPVDQRPSPPNQPTTRAVSRTAPSTGARRERWALAALTGECADIAAMAPDSGRNHALNGAAYKIGRLVAGGLLDEQDVRQALTDAGVTAGLPLSEATRTVESGLSAGMRAPRTAGDPA